MAVRRNTGSLLAVGLLAAACCAFLVVNQESGFVAPNPAATSAYGSSQSVLAQGFLKVDGAARSADVSMKAQVGGKPNRINLLYLATLLGTLVIGLIFTLGYGGYSGPGSSEIV
eukprot:TRINITY_DN1898_c1_g1_i2.p1 TRINITY_DN1898_c1_g1~~TRINITY_DN1898_c1_g1_i2.p1  ORF type:complete len:114 (+),score=28.26 TRINITY_DN1898_c1_g1_i2:71-412(+)